MEYPSSLRRLLKACGGRYHDVLLCVDDHIYEGHCLIFRYCFPILFHKTETRKCLRTYYHFRLKGIDWFNLECLLRFIYAAEIPDLEHFLPILETALQLGFLEFANSWYKAYTAALVCRYDEQLLLYYLCRRYNWLPDAEAPKSGKSICKSDKLAHREKHLDKLATNMDKISRHKLLPVSRRPAYPVAFYDKKSPNS